jgi:signal transduction histidine kinase
MSDDETRPWPGTATTTLNAQRWGLPPRHVLQAYLIGCVPLFIVYTLANETDGDFTRGFNLMSALGGTLRNAGPAFVLLLPVWAYTGWMERRGFRATQLLVLHGLTAIAFAFAVQACSYLLIWALLGLQQAERGRNQWFIWQGMFMMMMYWAGAGGFTAYRAVLRARSEAAATVQAQALLARTELAALRNKLNPHFLFNTLHSIIALARKDPPQAVAALHLFSDLLRYVLDTEKSGADEVPLREELDFTRDYLALESLRLGPRLTVDWRVDEAVMGFAVPALSLQPLVENSIKHAFNPRSAPGLLRVAAWHDAGAGLLHLQVADDGPGCAPGAWAGGPGLGIQTVARRLRLQHGQAGSLTVHTAPGAGFDVHLTLPTAKVAPP